jgi:YesN/AraC family two-component response regulator
MRSTYVKEKIKNLDLQYNHPSYALERKLLRNIEMGLLDESLSILSHINKFERAHLSRNSVRSLKNSLIGSCTLFTRAAIMAGISAEDAFDLSDALIQKIEMLESKRELDEFEKEMVVEFVELVKQINTKSYKYPISQIVTYIHEHVATKMHVDDLAKMVYISPDYLSKLFHKEVGVPLTEFIQMQKIEAAKDLLEYDEMKITDVSAILCYCNHGYFSNVFKKHTGQTPLEFRKNNKK